MDGHLTKDAPQETLFRPSDPWISNKKDSKPHILEHLDNIKLSRPQYIAQSIINYGPCINNMFVFENLTSNFVDNLLMN